MNVKKKSTAKKVLLTTTGLKYLQLAVEKEADPLHPNFRAALKPESLLVHTHIHAVAARAVDQSKGDPRIACITAARSLSDNVRAYIQFWKDIASNAAFAAHMDCVRLEQHVAADQIDSGLDALMQEHEITEDTPLYDLSDAQRATPREDYSGPTEFTIVATSVADAEAAIEGLQLWIDLAVSGLNPNQREFWGLNGIFPFAQRDDMVNGIKIYTPITDFEGYRAWQVESFRRKGRTVMIQPSLEELLLGA